MQRKLSALDRMPQIQLEFCPFEKAFPQLPCKYCHPARFFFCKVHRDVRITKNFFRHIVFGVARRNSDVHTDRDSITTERKRLSDAVRNTASDLLRLSYRRQVSENDRKLVAT